MESVARKMKQGVEKGVFPGGVLLVQAAGRIEFFEPFGVSSIDSGEPVERSSIFDLASLTKPLATALAFSKLAEDGTVRTGQTISSIVSTFNGTDKSGVTVDQLLRHTSGLPAYRPYYETLISHPRQERERVLHEFLKKEPLVKRPGEACVYSDIGYMILSWILREVSGMRLDRFVEKEIYTPLHSRDLFFVDRFASCSSGFVQAARDRMVATEKCLWRQKILSGEVHDDNAWALGGVAGHAGLFGSAEAVLKIAEEVLGALQESRITVLNGRMIRKFAEKKGSFSHVAGFDTPSPDGRSSAGRYFSSGTIGHLGFTGTSFWIDPVSSMIVILLTNRVHPRRENNAIRVFRPEIHDLVMERIPGKQALKRKECK